MRRSWSCRGLTAQDQVANFEDKFSCFFLNSCKLFVYSKGKEFSSIVGNYVQKKKVLTIDFYEEGGCETGPHI